MSRVDKTVIFEPYVTKITAPTVCQSPPSPRIQKHCRTQIQSANNIRRRREKSEIPTGNKLALPSYNSLRERFRQEQARKHKQVIEQLQNKLTQLTLMDLDQQHKQLLKSIESNNLHHLVNPLDKEPKPDSVQFLCRGPIDRNEETLNEQLQFQVPTSFQFYIRNKKKALYQDVENRKENIPLWQLSSDQSKRSTMRPSHSKQRVERYNAWYMPKKYWSKIKKTTNRQSILTRLKSDPRYLFKNLYQSSCQNPLADNSTAMDRNFQEQLQSLDRNRQELMKCNHLLKKLQSEIEGVGGKAWVLKYRIFSQDK